MPFDPTFPLPKAVAGRLGLTVVDDRDGRGRVVDWRFGPGSLGDHPGLAYYRFVPLKPDASPYKDDYATKFVEAVALRFAQDPNGEGRQPWHEACRAAASHLAAAAASFEALGRPVRTGTRTTASRLLVGTGYKNALEVGLTFHHPGGFPYLPGSSVKGLCRAWAEAVEGADADVLLRVFGSESKQPGEGEMQAGSVAFLDALPTRFPPLEADLLNPHVGKYYQGDEPPADWLAPSPVPFLAVGAGAPFRFAVVGRDADPATAADVERAWGWLMDALTDLGAGAKTAAGYGYFEPLDEAAPLHAAEPAASRSRPNRSGGPTAGPAGRRPDATRDLAEEARIRAEAKRADRVREEAEERDKKRLSAPHWAPAIREGDAVRARIASLGNPPRVHVSAAGHGRAHKVSMNGSPDRPAVGDWVVVQVETYNEKKGRATEVRFLAPAEAPGSLEAPGATAPPTSPTAPAPAETPPAVSPGPSPSGGGEAFEGTVKRLRIRGTSLEGQIDSPSHEALVKFDATAAGADASWEGARVRFRVEGGRGVDVEQLGS